MTKETHEHAVKRGKRSRAAGAAFELRTRKDLEEKEWIVDKWGNNVKTNNGKGCPEFAPMSYELIPAKRRYNPFTKSPMAIGTGFPDFIAFRNLVPGKRGKSIIINNKCKNCDGEAQTVEFKSSNLSEVIGVECKTNGYLDKEEIAKCNWYLDNGIFSKILIASKIKEGRKVVVKYENFDEKYGKS